MKRNFRHFCVRGAMYAWGGPVILAVVWAALQSAGTVTSLTVNQVVLGIVTTTVMAFIAAGISVIYQIENLPKVMAGLIQMAVLYIDYLGFYLLNGWVPLSRVWVFTLIFLGVFVVIWLSVYVSVKRKTDKMNQMLKNE